MSKHKILIIDDERSLTRMVRLNLETTGHYEVREENVSTRALATAREFMPDMVFLDVVMPGHDGGEVLARFQEDAALRHVPVVFLTATADPPPGAGKNVREGDGQRYLPKPVMLATLVQCIEEYLGKPPGTGETVK
jgi:CheY-like chemotaxis protein